MKKMLLVLAITLLTTGLLFAAPSWLGVQGTASVKQETGTEDHTIIPIGLNIAGTIGIGDAPVGIGFQAGFAKTAIHQRDGEELEVEDYPLTWNVGAAAKFRLSMTDMLALELGAGMMYERYARTGSILGTDYVINFNTLSAIIVSDLLIHVSDSFAVVGGVDLAFPLTEQGTYTLGGSSTTVNYDVEGYTITGKIGVAFGF
ncbi:hypothetical protein SAMN06298221_1232 [Sphaerochaeta associata]|uniref:Outer membrane protein beta-barrel domain-containing protein n=1 Tax=Sphaerochaeta associata TaxID=1129264 RepID=A0ABY4D914_9SPIR|nr:hypothetical protein [Sphaerochaeta associata]UOM50490.1 hypothetical protein MUG09_13085 [Sphaerochaeta associata]SMP66095.1 hypothetical protein SAMN06298221_1232 [Sphaerochaeta associata]